ncbi:MAG TPA: excinuclease ABC subunit UvrC [Bacilli bacterium]|nr:excinuclease ABC subunit UvrC [Bacilli bacterium]HQA55894.1 excinuclease ABC subunit UvrC [Bacilli bacterium]
MTEKIRTLIDNLKHLPGVYLMYDKDNTIIYVGKAKDLQKRVSQYFLRPQSGKVFRMVTLVDHFDTIITKNEKEALILEMNLIQKHYPRFNILLKDGSHYPYIALKKQGHPYLVIKRNDKDNKYEYFGPFPNSGAAYQMIDLLNKVFPIRKCKSLPNTPCLYYHLGQCMAPCINDIPEETHAAIREEIKSFMKGNNQKQIAEIKAKMIEASNALNFEQANDYKKILQSIEHINIVQNVENKDHKDRDIFAYSSRDGYLALAILIYRKGLLLAKNVFVNEEFGDNEEQVADLIAQYYQKHPLPKEVVINSPAIIGELRGILETSLVNVTRGRLHELIINAKQNADNALDEFFLSAKLDADHLALLEELGTILNIPTPLHIELFDNSHLQGFSPVGAMVAFVNGEPNKNLYRKFKIEHQESRDDLQSMKEIVYRHYHRLSIEEQKLPNLILVDGGMNQIIAGKEALKEAKVDIPLFGLAKNDKHQTAGLMDELGEIYPLENKKLFFLLTRMQDEVHRFAISFHREKRSKAMKSSLLDNIKGLGPRRKEMIYRAYPDINLLKNASVEELEQILPSPLAIAIYQKLHK